MFDSDDILECARSIRPLLRDVVGKNANDLDTQLATLLSAEDQSVDILHLLASRESTREWMTEFLKIKSSQSGQPSLVQWSYSPLPGHQDNIPAGKFECPEGDYVWYQPSVGTAVPLCPTHQVKLVRSV